MGRAIKSPLKLIDLFEIWLDKRRNLDRASAVSSVTPKQIRDEMIAYDILIERLKECNC